MGAVISFLVIAIVVLLILSSCIRIVPQAQALVVERLGAYLETWSNVGRNASCTGGSVSSGEWRHGRLACISRCRSLTAWQKESF